MDSGADAEFKVCISCYEVANTRRLDLLAALRHALKSSQFSTPCGSTHAIEVRVCVAQKRRRCAELDKLALIKHHDLVIVDHRAQTMRDGQDRAPRECMPEGLADQCIGDIIDTGCRLQSVEHSVGYVGK